MQVKLALQHRHIIANVTFEGEQMEFRFNCNLSATYITALLPKLAASLTKESEQGRCSNGKA